LGNRVFVIGGLPGNQVEEFNYLKGSWTIVANLITASMTYAGAISVPAVLFNNCTGTV
jgi:hypothetical protein